MKRKEERLKYALSFKGQGMENEELKENIQLAILDGAVWADKTMIDKACEWLKKHINDYLVKGRDIDYMFDDFRKAMEG